MEEAKMKEKNHKVKLIVGCAHAHRPKRRRV